MRVGLIGLGLWLALSGGLAATGVTRVDARGCLYGDALPDGTYVCSAEDGTVTASFGAWSLGDFAMFPRLSEDGTQIAAKSHDSGRVWHFLEGAGWTLRAEDSYGVNGHIFLRDGMLLIAQGGPHAPTQGYRYLAPDGRAVPGHETYAHPTLPLWEYSECGAWLVGQGEDGVIAVRGTERRKLDSGHTTFVRCREAGGRYAVAFSRLAERTVVFLWFTDPTQFPVDVHALDPDPEPQPDPDPDPQPDPQFPPTPNREALVHEVASLYPALLVTNTWQSTGEFTQRVVLALCAGTTPLACAWGHVGKSAGEGGATLHTGVRVSHDVIWHKPSNRQVDILGYAAANSHHDPVEVPPGPAAIQWDEIPREYYRASNVWTPAQPFGDDPKPEPKPDPAACDPAVVCAAQFSRIVQLEVDVDEALRMAMDAERAEAEVRDALRLAMAELEALQEQYFSQPAPTCEARFLWFKVPCKVNWR
jgi:hypothetical protein